MIIIGNSNTTVASDLCESSVDTGNKTGVLEKLHSFRDISPSPSPGTRTLITVCGPFEIYGPRVRTNCRKMAKITSIVSKVGKFYCFWAFHSCKKWTIPWWIVRASDDSIIALKIKRPLHWYTAFQKKIEKFVVCSICGLNHWPDDFLFDLNIGRRKLWRFHRIHSQCFSSLSYSCTNIRTICMYRIVSLRRCIFTLQFPTDIENCTI